MGDPYRDPGGIACPRCKSVMTSDADGGFACASGCGAWVPRTVLVRLLGSADLSKRGVAAPFFKVLGLPTTKCLHCATVLVAIYRAAGDDYVTLGQCDDHGVWCEQRQRADLELAFRREINMHRLADQQAVQHTQEIAVLADALGGDPRLMARRVLQLERQVATLVARLDALERER